MSTSKECYECGLHRFRKNQVVGAGDIPASILFVGEAPGRSEDLRAKPFVGPSGKLLRDAMKKAARLLEVSVLPSYYITNVVQCRPTDSLGGPNRQPTDDEIWACRPNFEAVLNQVKPGVVVFIGKVAEHALKKRFFGAHTLVHPAYILRKGGQSSSEFVKFVRELSVVLQEGLHYEEARKAARRRIRTGAGRGNSKHVKYMDEMP